MPGGAKTRKQHVQLSLKCLPTDKVRLLTQSKGGRFRTAVKLRPPVHPATHADATLSLGAVSGIWHLASDPTSRDSPHDARKVGL